MVLEKYFKVSTVKMPRTVKPLTDTEIKNSKLKDKDYKLSDGQGLYFVIKKIIARYGDMILFIVVKENQCRLISILLSHKKKQE
jgi:hypothetical protein